MAFPPQAPVGHAPIFGPALFEPHIQPLRPIAVPERQRESRGEHDDSPRPGKSAHDGRQENEEETKAQQYKPQSVVSPAIAFTIFHRPNLGRKDAPGKRWLSAG